MPDFAGKDRKRQLIADNIIEDFKRVLDAKRSAKTHPEDLRKFIVVSIHDVGKVAFGCRGIDGSTTAAELGTISLTLTMHICQSCGRLHKQAQYCQFD